jgi:bacterial/archaeal transporter family protein
MSWILLSLLSAVFLGVYDLLKKVSVRDNAVVPVLFFSTIAGVVVWLPFIVWSHYSSATIPSPLLRVDEIRKQMRWRLFWSKNPKLWRHLNPLNT